MKKIFLLLIIFFLPILVNAETCDTSNVKINSISIVDKTDSVEEISKPTFNKLEAKVNIKFKSVGDSITYRMTIVNDSGREFVLNKSNIESEYISYRYVFSDNSSTIPANSEKTVDLVISYRKQVPDNLIEDGYTESKKIDLGLSSDTKKKLSNPATNSIIVVLIVMVFIVTGLLIIRIFEGKHLVEVIILAILIMPVSIYALCTCTITTDSKIEVVKDKPEFCYMEEESSEIKKSYYEFEDGMVWTEFVVSDYNKDPEVGAQYYFNPSVRGSVNYLYNTPYKFVDIQGINSCSNMRCTDGYATPFSADNEIFNKSLGCYIPMSK